jgi:hypothetical protein
MTNGKIGRFGEEDARDEVDKPEVNNQKEDQCVEGRIILNDCKQWDWRA